MYKKEEKDKFEKDSYKVSLFDIDYQNVSICLVTVEGVRETFCTIKNSPIYYYIADGEGTFFIKEEVHVRNGELIEIPENTKYTYKGNMKMIEMIPNAFEKLEIQEEKL